MSPVEQPCTLALLVQSFVRLSHGAVRSFEIPKHLVVSTVLALTFWLHLSGIVKTN
jgi:hypothetical protein